jgi:hypothetical protein
LGYQALRFPEILRPESHALPVKRDLSTVPDILIRSGLFVPVSACLRLIAVSLQDNKSKKSLLDNNNLKAIVSHMVDDPLNAFQREAAIFVIKVLTTNYPPAVEALAQLKVPLSCISIYFAALS